MAWHDSVVAHRLGVRYPIVQGPFGGGLSSAALVAAVSNAGGLGSYGAHGLTPNALRHVVDDIRTRTTQPFAVNLWVSTEDPEAVNVNADAVAAVLALLRPAYRELGLDPPAWSAPERPTFEQQVEALIDLRVPVLSVVFGVPNRAVIDECRRRGIVTMGAATTVDEARALEAGGVDIVVASGFEAGGHRPSFLLSAEASLTGTVALVPRVADAVRVPVVAAGGIADGRGIAAALMLGAHGVQVGTAFLACEESHAAPGHRAALFGATRHDTVLTRGFSGRLARGVRNRLATLLETMPRPLPYPVQSEMLAPLRREALVRNRIDLVSLWAGQGAPLLRHRRAADLMAALVRETTAILGARAGDHRGSDAAAVPLSGSPVPRDSA
jgi:nitronate monooxygenase